MKRVEWDAERSVEALNKADEEGYEKKYIKR
jgi:hypothetical protein